HSLHQTRTTSVTRTPFPRSSTLHRRLVVATVLPAGHHRLVPDSVEAPMKDQRLNYAGIGGAVAGVVGLLGIHADWWETDTTVYHGTEDISGQLALAMSICLFALDTASALSTYPQIFPATSAQLTI